MTWTNHDAWAADEISTLMVMAAAGSSASQISRALVTRTRNAVVGKVMRLNMRLGVGRVMRGAAALNNPDLIGRKNKYKPAPPPRVKLPQVIEKQKLERSAKARELAIDRLRRATAPQPDVPIVSLNVSLMELGRGSCRWPTNNLEVKAGPLGFMQIEGEYTFCGLTADPDHTYCRHHRLRGTQVRT